MGEVNVEEGVGVKLELLCVGGIGLVDGVSWGWGEGGLVWGGGMWGGG